MNNTSRAKGFMVRFYQRNYFQSSEAFLQGHHVQNELKIR